MKKFVSLGLLLAMAALTTSCNIYGFMDSPSGDAQLESAARACFNQGDMTCARKYYAQLSTSEQDTAVSETALTYLTENGITMEAFTGAFVNGKGAEGVGKLANDLVNGAGRTRRLALLAAYNGVNKITSVPLRAFIRFAVAISLSAEILAESAHGVVFDQSDLASNPSQCENLGTSAGIPLCGSDAANSSCQLASSKLGDGTEFEMKQDNFDDTASHFDPTEPNLAMFNAAIIETAAALTALGTQGNAGGGLSAFADQFATKFNLDPSTHHACYRQAMIKAGIGA